MTTIEVEGSGTPADPWTLATPSGTSQFESYRDPDADPPALVVQVGTTELRYHLRCIDDLHQMLVARGDWMPLGNADEQRPVKPGTVEAWGRAADNPGRWVVRPEEGAPRTLRQLRTPRPRSPSASPSSSTTAATTASARADHPGVTACRSVAAGRRRRRRGASPSSVTRTRPGRPRPPGERSGGSSWGSIRGTPRGPAAPVHRPTEPTARRCPGEDDPRFAHRHPVVASVGATRSADALLRDGRGRGRPPPGAPAIDPQDQAVLDPAAPTALGHRRRMPDLDATARRHRKRLADEGAEAKVYRDLASRRTSEDERKILLGLADAEERHAAHWQALLGDGPARPRGVTCACDCSHCSPGNSARSSCSPSPSAPRAVPPGRGSVRRRPPAIVADEHMHAEVVRGWPPAAAAGLGDLPRRGRGANDGLVNNLAGARTERRRRRSRHRAVTGLAGLLSGALSMGAGECGSVRSRRELLAASTPDPRAPGRPRPRHRGQ